MRISNRYYQGTSNSGPTPVQQNIKKIFDSYRGKDIICFPTRRALIAVDDAAAEPDKIGFEGTTRYLQDLNISLEDPTVMALFHLVKAPAMAEIDREGFVDGWQNASSTSNPCDTIERQAQYATAMRQRMQDDQDYFRDVYRKAFDYAKPAGQRVVPMDDAFAYWDMFFRGGHGGVEWNTKTTPWMDYWSDYYKEKNKRPVNKDLWSQVNALVVKTKESGGESLDWWSEDGAWPTAVDDFVAFVKEKRQGNKMDTS